MQAQFRAYLDAGLAGPSTWSAGRVTASWFHSVGMAQIELTGTSQAQYGRGFDDAGAVWGGGRLHLHGANRGLWFGLEGGREPLGPVRRWEGAAWKNFGNLSLQLQGSQSSTSLMRSSADSTAGFPDTLSPANDRRTVTTTDVGLWARWLGSRAELALATGMRFGMRQPGRVPGTPGNPMADPTGERSVQTSSNWWMAEATWWLRDRIGLVGSVGQQPIDPAAASSGESFLRVGFRAALASRRRAEPPPISQPARAKGFEVVRLSDELVDFTLDAKHARVVELMGDFTDWSPVLMVRAGTLWHLRHAVSAGVHRINVRYDGGPWQAPPASRVVKDEFGQESGEVMIQ
jgi:hypothetical protein